jgi:chorismate synthase
LLGNTFGRMFRITACGESYGDALVAIIDGCPAGLEIDDAYVQKELDARRPGTSPLDSPRQETDQVHIFAGVRDNVTTGAPLGMIIYNVDRHDIHVQQYYDVKDLIRPGHAEYTYFIKYGKYADWCGAGRASGRETCMRVAAGAVAKKILEKHGIKVLGYVSECMGIKARPLTFEEVEANYRSNLINCPDEEAAQKMIDRVLEIKEEGDTAGGIVEVIARGVPAGLGEPVFDKLNATIAHGLMSIGSVRGVEFGAGFAVSNMKGSECNDIPYVDDNGKIRFRTNKAGGIEGGISNGEDIVVRVAVKPTATISIEQPTVNMAKMENVTLGAITRRDPTITARLVAVAEAMVRVSILDHLMMWRGYDAIQQIEHPWK